MFLPLKPPGITTAYTTFRGIFTRAESQRLACQYAGDTGTESSDNLDNALPLEFATATMGRLRERSRALTGALEMLLAEVDGVTLITPSDPARRGAMLTLRLPVPGAALVAQLAALGVVVDFRPPTVLRVTPAPLYNSYEDIWRFTAALKTTLAGVD